MFLSARAANAITSDPVAQEEISSGEINGLRMKSVAVLMATITDATFDILQGFAAIAGETYTSTALSVMIVATWIGVTDEVIEALVEIGYTSIMEWSKKGGGCCGRNNSVIFCATFLSWCVVESSLGIGLLASFDGMTLKVVGIIIELLLILLCIGFSIHFIITKRQ